MTHVCHVAGCSVPVAPKMLMCARHWFSVPQHLRSDVWATYTSGQESGGATPTPEWHNAADAALAAARERDR